MVNGRLTRKHGLEHTNRYFESMPTYVLMHLLYVDRSPAKRVLKELLLCYLISLHQQKEQQQNKQVIAVNQKKTYFKTSFSINVFKLFKIRFELALLSNGEGGVEFASDVSFNNYEDDKAPLAILPARAPLSVSRVLKPIQFAEEEYYEEEYKMDLQENKVIKAQPPPASTAHSLPGVVQPTKKKVTVAKSESKVKASTDDRMDLMTELCSKLAHRRQRIADD
jgi:hypothetical protein